MSVSNYTPDKGYKYSKLRNVLYLVDATHTKDIHIDNGVAYIDNLSQTPLKLEGFNITFKEEESLDERYKFQKTVTISLRGYANIDDLGERYYAIIETTDGTRYMVNVDFPSRITHTFNLSDETNQTDFTFSSYSNYPTLRLDTAIPNAQAVTCVGYQNGGLIGLKLINKDYAAISTISNKLTTYGDTFKTIDYLGKTCSFQEVFDGEKYTDTITFDIALDDYQTSWHYNLLEFMDNLYSAIISVRNSDYKYYSGFNYGLQPQVSIDVASTDSGNNSIRITLTEASVRGLIASDSIQGDESADKNWVYIKTYQGHDLWECLGQGQARYLVKQEIDALGNPTGRYMCLNGYQALFPYLNIVGTFNTTENFYEASCGGDDCQLSHGVPNTIYFDSITCYTYSLSSSCDWNIVETLPNITVSPSSGNGGERYYIQVCNTQEPTDTALVGTFNINYGGNTRIITTIVQKDEGFLRPNRVYITCNPQTVQFAYDPNCPITITSIDQQLTYTLDAGVLTVNVPRYTLTSAEKTWSIVAKDCNNEYQTVYIIQDKVYERWVATQQYMCVGGNSYVQEVRYTGATPTTIDSIVWPLEYRTGDLIQEGDPRCNKVITRYEWLGNYYCINGDKIKALEQVRSTDGGINWEKTGLTMLGETVETASTWCNTAATYSWILTDRTQCGEDEILTYTFEYCNGQKFAFQDVPSSGGTYDFCLRSLVNGNNAEWSVATACSYTHITATSTGYSVTVDENTDPDNDRECYIVLRQSGSGNRVTLNVIQNAGELQCNTLLDSCCGRGSHSDYDIQFGASVTGTTTDSVQGGCTIRMTSTLPYWLDVDVSSNMVTYSTTEINTGATRYYTVDFEKVSGSTAYCDTASVLVKQLGGAVPSTKIFRWQDGTVYKDTNPSADAGSETFSLVSTIDGVSTSYTASYSCDWVTANTSQNSSFTVNWAQNTSQSSRTCRITLTQNCSQYLSTCKTITLVINQSAGEQGETYFRWGDDQHMYEYSATTTYNGYLTLVPFASKVNGVDTNATLSSNVSWIQTYNQLYYNYNEVKPNRNETIYLDANYNEEPRTGTLTLTQKGTGDQIKVVITQAAYVADCTITSFNIADEVCIGQGLNYTFTVADTRCSRTTYFNLFQGYTRVTSTATPSGGIGNGVFQTSTLTAGTASATCVVNGQQVVKEIDVIDCGGGDTLFTTMLNSFNETLTANGLTAISSGATPNTYAYLSALHDEAVSEFNNNNSNLFKKSTYDEIYDYRTGSTTNHDRGLNAMVSWLMAMQISEIVANSGSSTNNQTKLFKKAYDLGGGRTAPLYGYSDLRSDVSICRLAASAIYGRKKGYYDFDKIDEMRTEMHTTVNNRPTDPTTGVSWTNIGITSGGSICDSNGVSITSVGYDVDFNSIFPSAAGPFATQYAGCTSTPPSRTYPSEQPSSLFNSTTKNYLVDEAVYNTVTSQYNLFANSSNFKRAVQAIADDSESVSHLFAQTVYYKYNTSSPRDTFKAGSPSNNNGSFSGTFDTSVIGEDVSSILTDQSGNETIFKSFFNGVKHMIEESRKTLLLKQYGRRRPAQGTTDDSARCVCGNGEVCGCTNCTDNTCISQNWLDDASLARLVGTGTKYDSTASARGWYIDSNGNGLWEDGEPYDGLPAIGSTNLCPSKYVEAHTYPSGHASGAWGVALFLMQMVPDKWFEIYKSAYSFSVSRTIVRAHWNSDIIYGKLCATAIVPIINSFNNAKPSSSVSNTNFRWLYNTAKSMLLGEDDYPDYTDGTAGNGIAFVYHNKTGKSICFNGKVTMYVKEKDAENVWNNTLPAFMNKYSSNANGYPHWNVNGHTLAPNETLTITLSDPLPSYSGNGVSVTDYTVPLSNYIGKQFVTADSATWPSGIAAIKFGHAGLSEGEIHSTNGLIHVQPIKPSACDIVRGRTYHLTIDIARTDHEEWNC